MDIGPPICSLNNESVLPLFSPQPIVYLPLTSAYRFLIFALVSLSSVPIFADQETLDRELVLACGRSDWDRSTIQRIQTLLASGASPNAQLGNGRSALQSAARSGNIVAVRELVGRGANLETTNHFGRGRPVEVAVSFTDIVKILLESGASPTRNALANACRANYVESAKLMITAGADPNDGLRIAAEMGHVQLVGLMLDIGADVNSVSSYGDSALHLAAFNGRTETVRLLLRNNARANPLNEWSQTPLHKAIYGNAGDTIIHMLVEACTDLSIADQTGQSAIRAAAVRNQTDVWRFLVEKNGGRESRPTGTAFQDVESDRRRIEELFALLKSKNDDECQNALLTMIYRDDETIAFIRKAIESGDSAERFAYLLQYVGPAAEQLFPLFESRLHDPVQARSIAKIMDSIKPGCLAELPDISRNCILDAFLPKPIRRLLAYEANATECELMARSFGNEAKSMIRRLHDANLTPMIRSSVARILYQQFSDNAEIEDQLIKCLLENCDDEQQLTATETLGMTNVLSEEAEEVLFQIITGNLKTNPQTMRAASNSLAKAEPSIIEQLIPLLSTDHSRWLATTTMYKLGEPAIPRLVELLSHDSDVVAEAAGAALRQMTSIAVDDALIAAIESNNDRVIQQAANVISWRAPLLSRAQTSLLKVAATDSLRDASRAAAVRAAIKLNRCVAFQSRELAAAVPALRRVLEFGSETEKQGVAESLRFIGE